MLKETEQLILKALGRQEKITAGQLAALAKVSRQFAHKQLAALVKRGQLQKIGTTRGAYYIKTAPGQPKGAAGTTGAIAQKLRTQGLEEDQVMHALETTAAPLKRLSPPAKKIVHYAFCEMLNNAIEHSRAKYAEILLAEAGSTFYFEVIDRGIGIFASIRKKFGLKDDFEALQELLKGKSTTAKEKHSGEGVFFTSKAADRFTIESAKLRLTIDNLENDVFVNETPFRKGTKIGFSINRHTKRSLLPIFKAYTDEEYRFSKTKVTVKLYEHNVEQVSRSQARRLLFGLEKFQTIILDFTKVKGIGQAFADEIFRVFAKGHPKISLQPVNASRSVLFMINRARTAGLQ
jgi:hypothetical protein